MDFLFDGVGEAFHFVEVVTGKQDGAFAFRQKIDARIEQILTNHAVESAERFVQYKQSWIVGQ